MPVKGQGGKDLPISDDQIWKAQQDNGDCQHLYQAGMDKGELTSTDSTKYNNLEDKVYPVTTAP